MVWSDESEEDPYCIECVFDVSLRGGGLGSAVAVLNEDVATISHWNLVLVRSVMGLTQNI